MYPSSPSSLLKDMRGYFKKLCGDKTLLLLSAEAS